VKAVANRNNWGSHLKTGGEFDSSVVVKLRTRVVYRVRSAAKIFDIFGWCCVESSLWCPVTPRWFRL